LNNAKLKFHCNFQILQQATTAGTQCDVGINLNRTSRENRTLDLHRDRFNVNRMSLDTFAGFTRQISVRS
jgi:hypothetical protein